MAQVAYAALSILVIVALVLIAVDTFRRRAIHGTDFPIMVIFAASAVLGYLISVLSPDRLAMSISSSVYFSSISLLLFFMARFSVSFTNQGNLKVNKAFLIAAACYLVFDVAVLMTNPLNENAISYFYQSGLLAPWRYVRHQLFDLHLDFCYVMIIGIVANLLGRQITTPRVYRGRYRTIIATLLLVVALNAVFLFFSDNLFDFSVLTYALAAFLMYLFVYNFNSRSMSAQVFQLALDNADRPLVFFDYEDRFALCNTVANRFVPAEKQVNSYSLEQFVDDLGLPRALFEEKGRASFDWAPLDGSHEKYRCDYQRVLDDDGRFVGNLFMFVVSELEYDPLTGFHTRRELQKEFSHDPDAAVLPDGPGHQHHGVVACDINRLSYINERFGRAMGDSGIRFLAESMRNRLPDGSYFVRSVDAVLIAVIPQADAVALRRDLDLVHEDMLAHKVGDESFAVQSAISMTGADDDVLGAAYEAIGSMRARKLLDPLSSRKSLLDSLFQMQIESGVCSQTQLLRGNALAERLGRRMGLGDALLSQLSLLQLFHDVGKVGVPLEVVSKPTALTDVEWDIMRAHAEKGYRIAKASAELSAIAEPILHHHEAWDGSGYPDGLRGEAIPLISRIIAVVDTYDVITHNRPFRPASSHEVACQELRRCAGTQFDPTIVSEFLVMLDEMDYAGSRSHIAAVGDEPVGSASTEGHDAPFLETLPMGLTSGTSQENRTAKSGLAAVEYLRYHLGEGSRIIDFSPNFEAMTGYSPEDVESYGLTQIDLIYPEDRDDYLKLVGELFQKSNPIYIEHRIRRKDGTPRYVFCLGSIDVGEDGQTRSTIIATDLTATESMRVIVEGMRESQNRSISRWEAGAQRDPLTGLLNRSAFRNDAQLRLFEHGSGVAMIMADLDHFKEYNDNYGHPQGDELLRGFAGLLAAAQGDNGSVARMGGDEFALIRCFDGDDDQVRQLAAEWADSLWREVSEGTARLAEGVTLSMGVAVSDDSIHTFDELYNAADMRLYKAKDSGRARLVLPEAR